MDNPAPAGEQGEGDDLDRARRGDHAAFARLYDRHAAVVMSICRALLAPISISDADDACQETFLRAFRLLDRLEPGGVFRPWVYAIARNVCAERRRSRARRTRLEQSVSLNGHPSSANDADAADRLAHRDELDRLGVALAQLPDAERLAIHLHYADPNPIAAAGEALGLSRSGFYKLLARARERLAAMVEGKAVEIGEKTSGIRRSA